MLSLSKLHMGTHISTFSTASKPYSIHLNPFMRLSCSNHQSGWNQPCHVTQWSHSPAFTCCFTKKFTGCLPAYHQTLGAPQMRATSSRGSPNPMACHLCAANILQWPAGKLHDFKKHKKNWKEPAGPTRFRPTNYEIGSVAVQALRISNLRRNSYEKLILWVGVGYRICNVHWVIACKKNEKKLETSWNIYVASLWEAAVQGAASMEVLNKGFRMRTAGSPGLHSLPECMVSTMDGGISAFQKRYNTVQQDKWYDIINRISIVYQVIYIYIYCTSHQSVYQIYTSDSATFSNYMFAMFQFSARHIFPPKKR